MATELTTKRGAAPELRVNAQRARLAATLETFLADTFSLYAQTLGAHWNVTGPSFASLHGLLEAHYRELQEAVDAIAERIRALGFRAPATLSGIAALASGEEPEGVADTRGMIAALLRGHERMARRAQLIISTSEGVADPATADLLTERLRAHEKKAWTLRSLLA